LAKEPEEALKGIRDVVSDVVQDMLSNGEAAPLPLSDKSYSGVFNVRIPPMLHRALAIQATEQEVSLNRLISAKLAA
jgi:predicted HicB family RNase H-like nuclease